MRERCPTVVIDTPNKLGEKRESELPETGVGVSDFRFVSVGVCVNSWQTRRTLSSELREGRESDAV